MVKQVVIKAPCKINLFLSIKDKMQSGYHNMDMVMQSLKYSDTIIITTREDDRIVIESKSEFIPKDETSIVYRAAKEFFNHTNIKNTGICVNIKNKIPHQAGLGGGSADGAGVLVGLNKLYNTNLTKQKLCEIGAKIGADIPFCIMGGTAHVYGIGDKMLNKKHIEDCYIVVAKPIEISVCTPCAFKQFDENKNKFSLDIGNMICAIEKGNIHNVCENLYNTFEQVLEIPKVTEIKEIMNSFNTLGTCMTGSGSAVFGIFKDEVQAKNCEIALKQNNNIVFSTKPCKYGAKVI